MKRLIFVLLILIAFTACKTITKLVPVKEIHIEYKDKYRIDSVYNRDTVEIYKQNDTIYKNVIKWREKFVRDTINNVRVDSIPYKVEVIKEVNVLTKWQRWRLTLLNVIGGLIIVYIAFRIGKAKLLL